MSLESGADDLERFRGLVARRLGLHFDDGRLEFLGDVLRRRLESTRCSGADYVARLAADSGAEIRALAGELTVGETYFFRNIEQFRALGELVLPERARARGRERRLRILSAGCASGEEPYSIAMVLRDAGIGPALDVEIRAVDLNPAVLERARCARYSSWALRETPPAMRRRWFREDGRDAVLDDAIRTAVSFEERNLVGDDAELWTPSAHDVVFFRNVVMYFTPDHAQALIARIARSLAPGGYLFLGHAETLRGLSQDFHLRHTHGTFYYQRKDGSEATAPGAALEPLRGAACVPSLGVEPADTWVDSIRRAAERIEALTNSSSASASVSSRADSHPGFDLRGVLELLRNERFAEALDLVVSFPPESTRDADTCLLRAVLLAHSGRLADAEDVSRLLLQIDELNAGAHYVLALCREGVGDHKGAIDHDRVAVYLDPVFAMPRLHLGLLARRTGDRESARRELGHALLLLQREDASRVLLFGGGFAREALIGLCRAEILACGGEP